MVENVLGGDTVVLMGQSQNGDKLPEMCVRKLACHTALSMSPQTRPIALPSPPLHPHSRLPSPPLPCIHTALTLTPPLP